MDFFHHKTVVRWNDLDANRHLANISYMAFCNDTRWNFFRSVGFAQDYFAERELGPVVLNEEFHYMKEIGPYEQVTVDLELAGLSEDRRFFRFAHRIFKENGEMSAYSTLNFGWISLETRKLILVPSELYEGIERLPKSENFITLQKSDLFKSIPKKTLNR